MSKISQMVYETSIKEIEKLDVLTIQEIEEHPLLFVKLFNYCSGDRLFKLIVCF